MLYKISRSGSTVLRSQSGLRGAVMEDIGYMVFGVAVAVLGIVLMYAYQRRSQHRRKD
jgi:hypothetical protein